MLQPYDRDNDIEYLFAMESREKKRTASGSYHNSGRRGGSLKGIKCVKMPSDIMKYNNKKDYKNYTKAGEVMTSNLYSDINNIPSLIDISFKDFNSAQNIMKYAKELHTNRDLMVHWKCSAGKIYSMLDKYEVPYTKKNYPKRINSNRGNKNEDKTDKINRKAELLQQQEELLKQALVSKNNNYQTVQYLPPPTPPEDNDEFQIKYVKKEVFGSEVQDRLMNYVGILSKDKQYEIKFIIKELPDKLIDVL